MDNGIVFMRYEKKYLLDEGQLQKFLKKVEPYLRVDDYGKTTIMSLYYDTPHYDLIRRSLDQPAFKEKFRVRSYGVPEDKDHPLFLELKKKYKGIVYKRRFSLPYEEAICYLADGSLKGERTQIIQEIDYARSFYQLEPKMMVIVDRTAYCSKHKDGVRMTIDEHIRARENHFDFSYGDSGTEMFEKPKYLIELKVEGAFPMWLTNILTTLEIYPVKFSKYGMFYRKKLSEGIEYV